jgi:hypothetical protein
MRLDADQPRRPATRAVCRRVDVAMSFFRARNPSFNWRLTPFAAGFEIAFESREKRGETMARKANRRAPGAPGVQRVVAERRAINRPGALPGGVTEKSDDRLNWIQVGSRAFPARRTTLGEHTLDILPDMPDIRDRIYRPHLRALHPAIFPRIAFPVRNQGADSSCTGFSLAHIIDCLRFREVGPDNPKAVSARMLYEMAKRNDEWEGSAYEGSSIRGAIKGFYRNGVCSDHIAPDKPGVTDWVLTYDMAKEARDVRLGAYLRVEPEISDYHAALNEVGVIYVSAQIHQNWDAPKEGRIEPDGKPAGGHAFAIVGYDEKGFWILNSWGPAWGLGGVAHWSYRDWATNVMDAWVLQLGVRAPDAFGAVPRVAPSSSTGLFGFGDPHRADILGHFINIDDGRLVTDGKYGSPNAAEMKQTVDRLVSEEANSKKGYDHLVIYSHGGLNDASDEAKRIAAWKRNDIFGRNKLYNFHLMWGSGFIDEVFGQLSETPGAQRVAGRFFDWLFEAGLGKEIGSYAWRNMKQDARAAFTAGTDYDGGFKGLQPLLSGLDKATSRPTVHLVGHSAGAIVLGNLLSALARFKLTKLTLGGIHLMAPGCTVEFFKQHYGPYLKNNGALKLQDKIYLYNLTDEQELDDEVSTGAFPLVRYSRSLLYLVSRAYEDVANTPLAGMQLYRPGMPTHSKLEIALSGAQGGATASTSHGGFDNDAMTLTTIMSRILGGKVPKPPMPEELTGY